MSDAVCSRTAESLARLVPGDNRPLVPGDLVCLYELLKPRQSLETPTQPQTLQKTQLAHKLGLLLGRLLDQHRVRPFGWQREGYCSMVQTSADGMCSVLACAIDSDNRSPPVPAQKSAQLVVVQQVALSELLPKLATALLKLADMMQATEQKSPSYKLAALALLQVAVNLIAVWPGSGGVLTSAAASATVVPAMQLAAAMVQHNITAPESCSKYSELALATSCRLVMHLGSVLLDERLRRTHMLQPLQGLSEVMSGLACPGVQQLVLTVIALATDPNIVGAIFRRANEDKEPMAAATEGQHKAAVTASSAISAPPAADKAIQASIADDKSSSTAQHGSTSSSGGDPDGVAAQHVELCQQQQLLLLQMLYPALSSSSRWADFAAISAAALSRVELTFHDFQYVVEAAIACFSSLADQPLNVGEGASASCSSSTPRGQASRTAAPAVSACSLNVLPQLPVLLLQWAYVVANTPEAYLDRSAVYEAVASLSSVALECWEFHLRLHRSHTSVSEEVNSRDQLPAARITELLLQNLRLLLQQQQALSSRAATSTPRDAVGPHGSAAAAAAAPATETGYDVLVGIVSVSHLSQLMERLKPFLDTAVWQQMFQEVYSMLEWWLRVGSKSHEEQQQQQPPQRSEACSSSNSSAVAIQWSDGPRFMRLYENGLLSGAVYGYRELGKACEVWLLPAAAIKTDESITWYDSVLLPCAAAAAPGSFERQQLLTLLISLLKKSSSTPGLLTLTPTGHAGELTIGCELGCVVGAVNYMLNLCGLCSSSGVIGAPSSSSSSSNSQDSSSVQGTCTTTAATTGRGGSSSNTTNAGCNSNGSTADERQAATAAAAAPWMVVAARALINKAERLSGCLEYQPEAPDINRVLKDLQNDLSQETELAMLRPGGSADAAAVHAFVATVKPILSDETLKLLEYTQPILHWTQCVWPLICALETALLGLTDRHAAASGNTTLTRLAVAADSGSGGSSHLHTAAAPAAAGEVLPQTAAAPAVTVFSVQQVQFGSALQHLQRIPLQLQRLTDICNALAPTPFILKDSKPAQWLQTTSTLGLAAQVVEALKTTSSIDAFRDALQLWGVQQLQQQLVQAGQLVCAAFPLKYLCNSPVCRNLSKSTESDIVNGKGCVCARCETARYCSRECQAAHWPWHKAICKAIKRLGRSSSTTY